MGKPASFGFVMSVLVLGMLYGIVAGQRGWVPAPLVQRAWTQAEALATDNPFSYLVPRVYDRHGARVRQPAAVQPGLTLISSMWDTPAGWERRVQLLGTEGAVVHEWRLGYGLFEDDSYLHGTHLLPNGDLIVNVEYVGTARLDACGTVQWRVPNQTHHSVARAENGSFWIPAQMGTPTTDYPGLDEPVLPEQILHVSSGGTVRDTIDVIDLLLDNGLARYIFKRHGPHPRGELLHLNDVEPLPQPMAASYPLFDAGDLLVSLRDLHLVFVVDPETQDVKWHAFGPFIRQHDPDFLGDGRIGVFDNNPDGTHRGTVLGGSRILVLEPPSDSTRVLFPTAQSDTFYTEAAGKWQRLDNGNLLLTESQAGRVVEVDSAGAPVWEYIRTPTGARVPEILDGARYALTREEVEGWPCGGESVSVRGHDD